MGSTLATKQPHHTYEATIDDDLFRERICLYLKVLFLIHLGFWGLRRLAASELVPGLDMPLGVAPTPLQVLVESSLTGSLGLAWRYVAVWQPPRWILHLCDAVVPPVLAAFYIHILLVAQPLEAGHVILVMVSAALVLRAALIPSSVARTVVVGIFGVAGAVVGKNLISPGVGVQAVWVGVLGMPVVAVTAVTSSVIYGLRKEVKAAKRSGQYELGRKLGEGGMGVVYEATHVLLRRRTAVKLLPVDKAGEEAIARFELEVRQTSRLEHPNNVSIYDYGHTPDRQFYYAMEYLNGLDLERLVRDYGPLGDARTLHLLRQAAQALAEAHRKGLVHRDVKPSNIMVCDRGGVPDTVKVLDFGLVKRVNLGDDDDRDRTIALTQTTTIVGTPHYLASEAIRGEKTVGPAADVYALGAVGYFLLTGREVFPGSSTIETFAKHLTAEPPSPSDAAGRPVDSRLEQALRRCLEKEPKDRFGDGRDFSLALSSFQIGGWSEAEAQEWWDDHQPAAGSDTPVSSSARTQLAVDVQSRDGG